ncbi:hypothetical protein J5N97_000995 [Dioscorea zingiberensis]|uniref:Uncharacterized protein n=1 Tax=Dioscorea zingiberensis TaxID=325984 RepID=A0A9D5H2R0_9LILI|nr:hypothetical protein J5N97_000995 [Dioscorea zingiberensis]
MPRWSLIMKNADEGVAPAELVMGVLPQNLYKLLSCRLQTLYMPKSYPTGTGFDYSSDERDIRRDEKGVSDDLYDFLQGFAIGNGLTNPEIQYKAYTDYALGYVSSIIISCVISSWPGSLRWAEVAPSKKARQI